MNLDSDLSPASYDDFPYPSYVYAQTHPDYLAALAILSGMEPAAVEQCRVLELGCASGGNLIPMAYSLPGGEFVGIDFSGRAISQGLESISHLGLENIVLHQMDLMDVDESLGQFDFIIAYGIFSWVPPEVQEKILEICRDHLAPQGITYISYNVYPGWHMFQAIRDAMFYHTQHAQDWPERVRQSRWLVQYLYEQFADKAGYFGPFLQTVQMMLKPVDDGYIRHDFLAEVNDPLYFHQFIERASRKGLKFLANGWIGSQEDLPAEVMDTVLELAEDTIAIEQYLDFMRNRSFRETLLCHESCPIQHELDPRCLKDLLVISRVRPEEDEIDLTSTDTVIFLGPGEKNLSTAHPLTKAALVCLESQYPKSIPYQMLVDQAGKLLSELGHDHSNLTEADAETLAYNLMRLHGEDTELISFHTFQPRIVAELREKPLSSAVARHQIELDVPVSNLYSQRVTIDKGVRRLLTYLDGKHDHQDLLDLMISLVDEGVIEISKDDKPVEDPEFLRSTLQELLDMQLDSIANAGLLVSG
jgi:methyltransferase-like protein/SAM-dependent methyltransferase